MAEATKQPVHYALFLALLTVVGGGALFVAFEKKSQHLSDWDGSIGR